MLAGGKRVPNLFSKGRDCHDPTPHRNQGAEVITEARGASVLRASETTVVAKSMLRAGGRL